MSPVAVAYLGEGEGREVAWTRLASHRVGLVEVPTVDGHCGREGGDVDSFLAADVIVHVGAPDIRVAEYRSHVGVIGSRGEYGGEKVVVATVWNPQCVETNYGFRQHEDLRRFESIFQRLECMDCASQSNLARRAEGKRGADDNTARVCICE